MLEHYQKFYLTDTNDLRAEIQRLGLSLPVTEDLSPLAASLDMEGHAVVNRLWLQPMQGFDADATGAPTALTRRRYLRYAAGGYGLLWVEATAIDLAGRAGASELCLHQGSLKGFADLVHELRASARSEGAGELTLILQLTHVGTFKVSDRDLAVRMDQYVRAAQLAAQAGFDGVDLKCCYGDALYRLLTDRNRAGSFRETRESRFRFLRDTLTRIRAQRPDLLLATRLTVFDAVPYPHGFGVSQDDYREHDLREPIALLKELQQVGLSILNLSTCSPQIQAAINPQKPITDTAPPQEHPLTTVARNLDLLRSIRQAIPGLHGLSGGWSWLRHLLPNVGAALVQEGLLSGLGLARSALAYPQAAQDILQYGTMNLQRSCMVCYACTELLETQSPTGCVLRDAEVYGREYRHQRRFDPRVLMQEIRRCHDCEAAPCMSASSSTVDIPGMLRHAGAGRFQKAYEVLRRGNVFPEMTAHLCPSWLQAEAACIENILSGRPVPIRDAQLTLARWAMENLDIGVRLPVATSGHRVAVVGGGPAGLAATVRLLEQGHEVTLFEREKFLGGAPERVIPASRFPGAGQEINAVLKPAIEQHRLIIEWGQSLGENFALDTLQSNFHAVLLAMGLTEKAPFGGLDSLTFLKQAKTGERKSVPSRVAVLSGGDGAMDAAKVAQMLGAQEVFIVFQGPRADMHWHLEESWFACEGVHCLILHRPLGYEMLADGIVTGLRLIRTEPGGMDVPNSESVLKVDLVIEAIGLSVNPSFREYSQEMPTGVFAAGALCNGGASVEQCMAEGLTVADAIHQHLDQRGS